MGQQNCAEDKARVATARGCPCDGKLYSRGSGRSWETSDIFQNKHGSLLQNFSILKAPQQMGQGFLHMGPRRSLLVAAGSLQPFQQCGENAPVRHLRHLLAEAVGQQGKDQGLAGATEGVEAALGLSGTMELAQHQHCLDLGKSAQGGHQRVWSVQPCIYGMTHQDPRLGPASSRGLRRDHRI